MKNNKYLNLKMNKSNDNSNIQNINENNSINNNLKGESSNKCEEEKNNLKKEKTENNSNNIDNDNKLIQHESLKDIKYGINENGNPIKVSEYYKEINNDDNLDKIKKPRLIAYIKKDQFNNNELIDLNGNKILKKNEKGDYEFPLKLNILIKSSDVLHPELKLNNEKVNNEKKIKENIIINDNINNKKGEKLLLKDSKKKTMNMLYPKKKINIDINNVEKYLFKSKNENEQDKFMKILRFRYGSNNISNNYINVPTTKRLKKINTIIWKRKNHEIISRTNSILNMNKSNDNLYYKFKYKNKINYNLYNNNKKLILNNDYYNINNNLSMSKIKSRHKRNFVSSNLMDFSISQFKNNYRNNSLNISNNNFNKIIEMNNSFNDIKNNKKKTKKIFSGINNNNYINTNYNLEKEKNRIINSKNESQEKCYNDYWDNKYHKKNMIINNKNNVIISSKLKNLEITNNNFDINCHKIKYLSKKANTQKIMKCSVLTEEANNMIKKFLATKKLIKRRYNNDKKNSKNRYISSPIISYRNKSFD